MAYKPQGYTSVSPYLIVLDAAAAIAFMTRVFGATEIRRFAEPGNPKRVMHAEVRLDDSVIMLGESMPEWPPAPCHIHVYVADVDAVYQRALEAGGTAVQAPTKKQDEDKRGGVKDSNGTTWWMATKVE